MSYSINNASSMVSYRANIGSNDNNKAINANNKEQRALTKAIQEGARVHNASAGSATMSTSATALAVGTLAVMAGGALAGVSAAVTGGAASQACLQDLKGINCTFAPRSEGKLGYKFSLQAYSQGKKIEIKPECLREGKTQTRYIPSTKARTVLSACDKPFVVPDKSTTKDPITTLELTTTPKLTTATLESTTATPESTTTTPESTTATLESTTATLESTTATLESTTATLESTTTTLESTTTTPESTTATLESTTATPESTTTTPESTTTTLESTTTTPKSTTATLESTTATPKSTTTTPESTTITPKLTTTTLESTTTTPESTTTTLESTTITPKLTTTTLESTTTTPELTTTLESTTITPELTTTTLELTTKSWTTAKDPTTQPTSTSSTQSITTPETESPTSPKALSIKEKTKANERADQRQRDLNREANSGCAKVVPRGGFSSGANPIAQVGTKGSSLIVQNGCDVDVIFQPDGGKATYIGAKSMSVQGFFQTVFLGQSDNPNERGTVKRAPNLATGPKDRLGNAPTGLDIKVPAGSYEPLYTDQESPRGYYYNKLMYNSDLPHPEVLSYHPNWLVKSDYKAVKQGIVITVSFPYDEVGEAISRRLMQNPENQKFMLHYEGAPEQGIPLMTGTRDFGKNEYQLIFYTKTSRKSKENFPTPEGKIVVRDANKNGEIVGTFEGKAKP